MMSRHAADTPTSGQARIIMERHVGEARAVEFRFEGREPERQHRLPNIRSMWRLKGPHFPATALQRRRNRIVDEPH